MEVIVVDDGSSDKTSDAVKDYPIRYFHQNNAGPASARNRGIREARGEIVLFIDSDCVPQPGWLKAMTAPFADPEIDGVKGIYITRQRGIIARFIQLEFEERYRLLARAHFIDFIDSYSAGFKKEKLQEVGGFDENFPKADNEDVDLSYKLAAAGCKMVFQPEAVVEHTHPDTLIKYIKLKFFRAYWREMVYRRHPDKAVKDSYTPQNLKLQMLAVAGWWIGLSLYIAVDWSPLLLAFTALYIFSLFPFILRVYGKDNGAESLTPLILLLRAHCFIAGTVFGAVIHRLK